MILASSIAQKKLPDEAAKIAALVKAIVHIYDLSASVILFGSRARGDAEEESDWDFLILTEQSDTDLLLRKLIPVIRGKIEMIYLVAVSLIIKNKKIWDEDYAVTNIYESITEEGIAL